MSDTQETPQRPPSGPALTSQPAVVQAVIQIKRAATGKVEEYTITGVPVQPEKKGAE